ncbi:MAG: hypothetical protein ACI89D_001875 [Bermanella sp.]|jgi:hypothetical protein
MMRKYTIGLAVVTLALVAVVAFFWLQMGKATPDWIPTAAPAMKKSVSTHIPCNNFSLQRQALFGDLHVHTAYSNDARSWEMLSTPADAYRFSTGQSIALGPFDDEGRGLRTAQLQVPLDFAAVTDHAESLGEVRMCTDSKSERYHSKSCRTFRGDVDEPTLAMRFLGLPLMRFLSVLPIGDRSTDICGEDASLCRDALRNVWQDNQVATEHYYDRSAECRFTSFHGWEYSWAPSMSKVHRNIIFRNSIVPELPYSASELVDPLRLWERLDRDCINNGSGCDALSIPHNPNASNGRMFATDWLGEDIVEQRRRSALRRRMEPVVEMMQIKGESECKIGFSGVIGADEYCNFEKMRGPLGPKLKDCGDGVGAGALMGRGCQSRLDFVRYALIEGMVQQTRLGVNPYQFGFVGGTDTHNAIPGDTDELDYQGCCANTDTTAQARLGKRRELAPRVLRNPGGLMGVWAEQNTRESIFDAIQRRETFATSGVRIRPRLFAGRDLALDACEGDIVEAGYQSGVSMGSEIASLKESPVFIAAATSDANSEPLQQLQIIKIWHDKDGNFHQSVHTVAGDSANGAGVDLDSCKTYGEGARSLCGTWRDPQFQADQSAAYYLRVIENPSCRWSWRQCLSLEASSRPSACEDSSIPRMLQERAWTSPVWYRPDTLSEDVNAR